MNSIYKRKKSYETDFTDDRMTLLSSVTEGGWTRTVQVCIWYSGEMSFYYQIKKTGSGTLAAFCSGGSNLPKIHEIASEKPYSWLDYCLEYINQKAHTTLEGWCNIFDYEVGKDKFTQDQLNDFFAARTNTMQAKIEKAWEELCYMLEIEDCP